MLESTDYITAITLLWMIITMLFTETDRELLDLLHRLKYAISITPKGTIDTTAMPAYLEMGAKEVFDYGSSVANERNKESILEVQNKWNKASEWKEAIGIFLMIVTIGAILEMIGTFDSPFLNYFLNFSIIAALLIASGFYVFVLRKINNVKLIKFAFKETKT